MCQTKTRKQYLKPLPPPHPPHEPEDADDLDKRRWKPVDDCGGHVLKVARGKLQEAHLLDLGHALEHVAVVERFRKRRLREGYCILQLKQAKKKKKKKKKKNTTMDT
jgi:hypothetical protein